MLWKRRRNKEENRDEKLGESAQASSRQWGKSTQWEKLASRTMEELN